MITTTINDKRRHELVGLRFDGQKYDYKHFDGLNSDNLQRLIGEGFADINETQNDAPSIGEIADFLLRFPKAFTAHGYIITPERDDCRVSLEGVEGEARTEKQRQAFLDMFRLADEFSFTIDGTCRAWYD